jgi:hypothetical protein
MVAPAYAERRSGLAKQFGLGRAGRKAAASTETGPLHGGGEHQGDAAGLGHELRPISFDEQTPRFALGLWAVN